VIVLLLLLALPIVEIIVAIEVARAIGGWLTLLLLLAGCAVGQMVLRTASRRTGQSVREALDAGRAPGAEVGDSLLLFLGGLLLLIPGFVTDVFGIVLVLPVTRPLARRLLARRLRGRMVTRVVGRVNTGNRSSSYDGQDVIEGEVVDEAPGHEAGPRSLGG
jgi:UPF0716 protein FxsA